MAEKISTLILKVDLACHKCYNKIRKILCNLQDQERITTISYDTKNNIVVIAGTFDPQRLCCRIRCKGGKVIKDTHIVDAAAGLPPPTKMADSLPPPPPPQTMNSGKKKKWKKDKRKECPPPPVNLRRPSPPHEPPPPPENMQPPSPAQPPAPQISTVGPAIVEEEKPRERPAELELPPPPSPYKERPPPMEMPPSPSPPVAEKPCPRPPYHPPPAMRPYYPIDMTATTTMVEIPSWPAAPAPPCYRGCYEGCRCGSCGRVYGYSMPSARPPSLMPPPTATCYGGGGPYCGGYSGCRIVNEEDPTACTIM